MAEEPRDEEMLEFEQRYGKNDNSDRLKKIVIALGAVAAVLAIILVSIWIRNARLVKDLNQEKEDLTVELLALQSDYDSLSTTNLAINDSLNVEKEKVGQLIERLQQTEATNRAKIRQYEKELGTLRSIMKGYIKQIDSLNTLNTTLRNENTEAKKQNAQLKQDYDKMRADKERLDAKVASAIVVKARDLSLVAINEGGREVRKSRQADKLKACLTLVENQIADKGERQLYMVVFDPNGTQLAGEQQTAFYCGGEELMASSSRSVDYQGEDIEVCIYYTKDPESKFTKGVYKVDLYSDETKLGTVDILLK